MKKTYKLYALSLCASIALSASATKAELESHKKIVGYFPEWGVYSAHNNYAPSDTPFDKLTHVNYAFARILNGEVAIFDNWAATGITFNESWDSPYKGTLGQFKKLKSTYPDTSFLISVGGWTQSAGFHDVSATEANRAKFAQSCVAFVRRWHFDGIDIDWEFPTFAREPDTIDNANDTGTPKADASEKETFTLLLKSLREALDIAGSEDGRYYQLTAAVGASKKMIEGTNPEKYSEYLDFINVMTYDLHGAWETKTNHQAPLVANNAFNDSKDQLSISDAVRMLQDKGVQSSKIVIGSPFYSRGWKGVENDGPIADLPGLGATATGGAAGIWDGGRAAGVNPYYHIKERMETDKSFVKYRDPVSKMPYLYSESKGEMYTYDDEVSVGQKSDYVNTNDLGGIIFWEVTADYPSKGSSLTSVIYNAFFPQGHPVYANENRSETIEGSTDSEETIDNDDTTIGTIDEESVNDNPIIVVEEDTLGAWNESRVYIKGTQVTYNGHLYEASWWNQGEIPDATQWGPWKHLAPVNIVEEEEVVEEPTSSEEETTQEEVTEEETTQTDDSEEETIEEVVDETTTDVNDEITNKEIVVEMEEVITIDEVDPEVIQTYSLWNSTQVYTQGMVVTYEGYNYQAQWWTKGEIPGSLVWGAWRVIDASAIIDNTQDNENTENEDNTNTSDPEVSTNGASEWQSGTIYFGGEEALYNGHLFKSRWWSRGDVPIASAWGVWEDMGVVSNDNTVEDNTPIEDEVVTDPETNEDDVVEDTVIVEEADLNTGMFAPFVDTTAWPPYDFVSNSIDSGNLNYALGFLVAKNSNQCESSWGTYYELDNSELGMVDKINTIYDKGGRVLLSLGGAANVPLAAACENVESLVNEYQRVIDTLHLKEMDFDIEGGFSRDSISIERRSAALKIIQENNPDLKVWFTLAVLPSGLTQAAGMAILRSAIDAGVKISGVNIMAMDYGEFAAPNPQGQMGYYAIEAAKSLHAQLKILYPTSDEATLWKMVGITPMIGMNDVTTEIFDQDAAREVLTFAKQKDIGLISLWSANRDKECSSGAANYVSISCSSVLQNNNEFSTIFSAYGVK